MTVLTHMRSVVIAATMILVVFPTTNAADGFTCKDLHVDCPHWRRNMAHSQNMVDSPAACHGQDHMYMVVNCPVTCKLCDEARANWEAEEAQRRQNPVYEPHSSHVHVVDKNTIDDFLQTHQLMLLEFYASWCGHCQQLAPAFREAANAVSQMDLPMPIHFVKFDDGDEYNKDYAAGSEQNFNFSSYPSFYVIHRKKKEYYAGPRTAEGMIFFMTQIANGRSQKQAYKGWNDVEKRKRPGIYRKGDSHETTHFDDLHDGNFRDRVLRTNKVMIVEYYSDQCPICDSLAPEFIKACGKAKHEFGDKVECAAINSRVFNEFATPFGVTSYPWVTSFYLGKNIEHMSGMGGWESFYKFAKRKKNEVWKRDGKANHSAEVPPAPPEEDDDMDDDALLVGGPLPKKVVEGCDAETEESIQATCSEKETKYIFKQVKKLPDEWKKENTRLQKMVDNGDKMAIHLLEWAKKRLHIIDQISSGWHESNSVEIEAPRDDTNGNNKKDADEKEYKSKGAKWRATLGRQAWFVLHTIAAKYPKFPSNTDKKMIRNLVAALGQHYPCKLCRTHLQEKLRHPELGPVAVGSRFELARWFCKLHNMVNKDTGKEKFDCSDINLDMTYLKDCGECTNTKEDDKGMDSVTGEGGVWNAAVYAQDPELMINSITTVTDSWKVEQLTTLIADAVAYNYLSLAEAEQLKSVIKEDQSTIRTEIANLRTKMKPLIELQRRLEEYEHDFGPLS